MLTNHFHLVSPMPPISIHLHTAKLEMTRKAVHIPHSLAAVGEVGGGGINTTSSLADPLKTMNKNECYTNLFCNNNL